MAAKYFNESMSPLMHYLIFPKYFITLPVLCIYKNQREVILLVKHFFINSEDIYVLVASSTYATGKGYFFMQKYSLNIISTCISTAEYLRKKSYLFLD